MNKYTSSLVVLTLSFASISHAEPESLIQKDANVLNAFVSAFSSPRGENSPEPEETVIDLVSKSISEMECFPENQLKKFHKAIANKNVRNNLTPTELSNLIGDARTVKSLTLSRESLLSLSHMYEVVEYSSSSSTSSQSNSGSTLKDNGMSTADTYVDKLIDPFSMVDGQKINFIYTIDCSGLLTGAIKAGVDLGSNGVKIAAENSLEKSGMTFIASGNYMPALWAALNKYQNAGYVKHTDSISLLSTLGNAMIAKKISKVGVPSVINVLIIDKNGSSKAQGRIEGNINFSGGYGPASGSAAASAAYGFSRTFNFYNPTAIILARSKIDNSYDLESIKSVISSYLSEIDFGRSELTRKAFLIKSDLNRNICQSQTWKVKAKIKDQSEVVVTVTTANKKYDLSTRQCTFEIPFDQVTTTSFNENESILTLSVEGGIFSNLKNGNEPKIVTTIKL